MATGVDRDGLPDAYPLLAPPLHGRVMFDQEWRELAFLHWPVAAEAVAPLFPKGTEPDEFAGSSWVSLVPFRMRGAGPGAGHPVPYLGSFLETNVRLYSRDSAGRHGVLFRSLDCDRLAVVLAARLAFGLPYMWARMREKPTADVRRWQTARRWPRDPAATSTVSIRVGALVEPTPLDVFLTARWGAHTSVAGRTVWIPNSHDAWPLQEAVVEELDDGLCAAAGVPVEGPPALVRFSSGVRTVFGLPRGLDARATGRSRLATRRLALRRGTM